MESLAPLILAVLLVSSGGEPGVDVTPADPMLQAQIAKLCQAIESNDAHRVIDEAGRLRKMAGDERRLAEQVVLYAFAQHDAEGAVQLLLFSTLSARLRLIPQEIVAAVAPYLESDNRALRGYIVEYVLKGVDDPNTEPFDLMALSSYLQLNRPKLPPPVVEIMFRQNPGKALLILTDMIYLEDQSKRRPLMWAEHVVADAVWKWNWKFLKEADVDAAVTQLERLSRSPDWWVRLYVEEILWRHDFLRTGELVERIKNDEHPTVRRLISRPKRWK